MKGLKNSQKLAKIEATVHSGSSSEMTSNAIKNAVDFCHNLSPVYITIFNPGSSRVTSNYLIIDQNVL